MQETPYQTADARDSLSDSGCRGLNQRDDAGDSIRKRMQEIHHHTADTGVSLSDS